MIRRHLMACARTLCLLLDGLLGGNNTSARPQGVRARRPSPNTRLVLSDRVADRTLEARGQRTCDDSQAAAAVALQRNRRPRLRLAGGSGRLLVSLGLALGLLVTAVSAYGYLDSTGAGSASGRIASLNAPTNLTAGPASGSSVPVSWTDSSSAGAAVAPQGYYVTETNASNLTKAACGTSSTSLTPAAAVSCTDGSVPPGTYTYTVTAVYNSWSASASTAGTVMVATPSRVVSLTAKAPAHAATVAAPTHYALTASSTTPTAGAGDPLTITAEDANDDPVDSYSGEKTVTFAGASTTGSFDPTVTGEGGSPVDFGTGETIRFTDGVATVSGSSNGAMTLYQAGAATITVSDGTISSSGSSIDVSAGAAASFVVSVPAAAVAGSAFGVSLTAEDAFGNTASGYTGRVAFASSDAGAGVVLPASYAFVAADAGVHTFTAGVTLVTAAPETVSATDTGDGSLSGVSSSIDVSAALPATLASPALPPTPGSPAVPSTLAFTGQPTSGQNIQATGTGSFSASVSVEDANGNVVTTDDSPVTLAIDDNPSAGVLTCTDAGGLTVAASSGVASFTGCAISESGAGYTLTATDSALTVPSDASPFTITAGTAATTAVDSGSPQSTSVGSAFGSPLVALVTDINGNPVSGASVTFTAPASGASGTFGSCTGDSQPDACVEPTGSDGQATSATFTANTTAAGYGVAAAAPGTSAASFSLTNNATAATPPTLAAVDASTDGASTDGASTNGVSTDGVAAQGVSYFSLVVSDGVLVAGTIA